MYIIFLWRDLQYTVEDFKVNMINAFNNAFYLTFKIYTYTLHLTQTILCMKAYILHTNLGCIRTKGKSQSQLSLLKLQNLIYWINLEECKFQTASIVLHLDFNRVKIAFWFGLLRSGVFFPFKINNNLTLNGRLYC